MGALSAIAEQIGLPGKAIIAERLRARMSRPHPNPLFIFGNQKAGGTALAGLLAAATGQRASLDLPGSRAPYFTHLMHGQTSLDTFVAKNAYSFSAPIIKDGNLTFVAEPLMEMFAVEQAVFLVRYPYDNIRSILDRLRLPGHRAQLDIGTIRANPSWKAILSGEDLGLPPDHYIATLARRWLLTVQKYDALRRHLVTVRYRDFFANRKATIERLARRFDLCPINDISALAEHPFQRAGRKTTDYERFFGRDNLARIDDICGEAAAAFGYTPPR